MAHDLFNIISMPIVTSTLGVKTQTLNPKTLNPGQPQAHGLGFRV